MGISVDLTSNLRMMLSRLMTNNTVWIDFYDSQGAWVGSWSEDTCMGEKYDRQTKMVYSTDSPMILKDFLDIMCKLYG